MSRRTSALYEAIFVKVNELCPNLKVGLQGLMSDFEPAIIKGIWSFSKKFFIHSYVIY